jgi:hypothetical protein
MFIGLLLLAGVCGVYREADFTFASGTGTADIWEQRHCVQLSATAVVKTSEGLITYNSMLKTTF